MSLLTALLLALLVAVVTLLGVRIVPQQRAAIVERLGRFHRVLDAGIHVILPFVDRIVAWHDLRIQQIDVPAQSVITRDNVNIQIDNYVFFEILDPKQATYGINNYRSGIVNLTVAAIRDVIGKLDLDQTLSSRNEINAQLRLALDEATHRWGIRIDRVELKDIRPPQDVQQAMEKQMRAEREKRAAILEAEGRKTAAILLAEGEKQAAILRAEAEKEAAIRRAEGVKRSLELEGEGEALKIERIAEAELARNRRLKESELDEYVLAYRSFEALRDLAQGQAAVVFVPTSAVEVLAGMGALKEVFRRDDGRAAG